MAITEIYKYAKRYRPQVSSSPAPCALGPLPVPRPATSSPHPNPQIMAALEANPTARRTQLHQKLEQVLALMEDDIYQCYSEA